MTCQEALSLLDQYIDNELLPNQAAAVKEHFENCSDCFEEFQLARKVKLLLKENHGPKPDDNYWSEVTELTLARISDIEQTDRVEPTYSEEFIVRRKALVRSIISVAASMVILFSALFIGLQHNKQISTINQYSSPVLATADVRDLLAPDNTTIFSREYQCKLAQGMLLVGMPGTLGRFAGLPELINEIE